MRKRLVSLIALLAMVSQAQAAIETAVFAGGCFWSVEYDFDHTKGVTSVVSGYAGGTAPNPTYEHYDGYLEAVKVTYDTDLTTYQDVVRNFLRATDVVDDGGQFCDRGDHYRTAIFAMNDGQKQTASEAITEAERDLGKKVVTPVRAYTNFYPAEAYHQHFWQGQNRVQSGFHTITQAEYYEQYRLGCGRDARIKALWGKAAYTDGHGSKPVRQ